MSPPRPWVWVQLLIGWLPAWALFTLLMASVHDMGVVSAALNALRMIMAAALLGLVVHHLTRRWPWPYPLRWSFIWRHVVAAPVFAIAWIALNSLVQSALDGRLVVIVGPGFTAFLVTGIWFYVMVAGVSYAHSASQRLAQMRELEARSQMAVLQAQLRPHFVFNALHTVVQLIPLDARQAVHALEQLAGLMRASLAEPQEQETLSVQWGLVRRYLAIEQLRMGDRLIVREDIDPRLLAQELPSFTVQTLVENAVRHAVEPSTNPVTLHLRAQVDGPRWWIELEDDGASADGRAVAQSAGTGLRRLRERLGWLHGASATLEVHCAPGAGFRVRLYLPRQADHDG
ncbi:MAG: sensor histidine kinase [Aquabacterium sp.]